MAMIAVVCLSIFVSQTEAIPLEVSFSYDGLWNSELIFLSLKFV